MTILVTGAAGFIGAAVAHQLLDRGDKVVGVDNFNDYYDPKLKSVRAHALEARPGFEMVRLDIADAEAVAATVRRTRPAQIVHLAAQAGVRYSLDSPFSYERSNLAGHLSILEACRHGGVESLVYASSSSVYGERPLHGGCFRESDAANEPESLYAATKRACELMSTSYSKLFGLKQSGLRFFTVYGPLGRPDMAYFGFTRNILAGEPIEVFGNGEMERDFTYIDDIVDGILAVLQNPPEAGRNEIYNIGRGKPEPLLRMIEIIEDRLGVKARKIMRPMQPGDVTSTFADTSKLSALSGYAPKFELQAGLNRFIDWYLDYQSAC